MKGQNTLQVNLATMLEIVQKWIDEETNLGQKVTSISQGQGNQPTFDIKLEDHAEEKQ